MTDLKELNKKLEEDSDFAKDLEENAKTVNESELNEDELENVSGGIRPASPKDSRMV